MDIAITIDELLLWDGTPMPRGYTPHTVMDGLLDALAQHDVAGVYAFSHTSPVEDDPSLRKVLERWCEGGHHLGNHTHCHANLNWLGADQYCADIRVAEGIVGDLVDQAPVKYFRHAMDMSGRSEAKRGAVEDRLRDDGYTTAPITAWFGDFAWTAPYARALDAGDRDAVSLLRTSYVEAAVGQLHAHADAARRMFGADLPYIWLIHGTSLAQDLLGEILARFAAQGARFVSLEEAMKHPVNRAFPPVSGKFANHLQRYALAAGDAVAPPPAELTMQVLTAALPAGENPMAIYDDIIGRMCTRAGGALDWSWE
jgi:peptidoglycan/xylan/chitin deacetylase (PgdA/CDA1 family)